jgi:hypothetical protein
MANDGIKCILALQCSSGTLEGIILEENRKELLHNDSIQKLY